MQERGESSVEHHSNQQPSEGRRSKSVSDIKPNTKLFGPRTQTSVSLPMEDAIEVDEVSSDIIKDLPSVFQSRNVCARLLQRRNALCDPEKMAMPQDTRERIQKDVESRRKSLTRKLSNYLSVRMNLNAEEDLI